MIKCAYDFCFNLLQEEGTRIWQNTTVVSQVVDKPISLEFVTKHKTVVTPGLPYKLKVNRGTRQWHLTLTVALTEWSPRECKRSTGRLAR